MILSKYHCPAILIEGYEPNSPEFQERMFERHIDALIKALSDKEIHPVEFRFAVIGTIQSWKESKYLEKYKEKVNNLLSLLPYPPQTLLANQAIKEDYCHLFVFCLSEDIQNSIDYFYENLNCMVDENYIVQINEEKFCYAVKISHIALRCYSLLPLTAKKDIENIQILLDNQPEITFNQSYLNRRKIFSAAMQIFYKIQGENYIIPPLPFSDNSLLVMKESKLEDEWTIIA